MFFHSLRCRSVKAYLFFTSSLLLQGSQKLRTRHHLYFDPMHAPRSPSTPLLSLFRLFNVETHSCLLAFPFHSPDDAFRIIYIFPAISLVSSAYILN